MKQELKQIKDNELINKKHKKTCKTLNYVEQLLILVPIFASCVSISPFTSLVCIPLGITCSVFGLKYI